jgi:hypothetical protein
MQAITGALSHRKTAPSGNLEPDLPIQFNFRCGQMSWRKGFLCDKRPAHTDKVKWTLVSTQFWLKLEIPSARLYERDSLPLWFITVTGTTLTDGGSVVDIVTGVWDGKEWAIEKKWYVTPRWATNFSHFHSMQNGSWAHPAYYSICTGDTVTGSKTGRR